MRVCEHERDQGVSYIEITAECWTAASAAAPGSSSPPVMLWPARGCSYHCQSQKKWILLTSLLHPWLKNDVARLHVWARHSVSTLLLCWDQNQFPLAGGHMSQSHFFQKTLQVAQTARVSDLQTKKTHQRRESLTLTPKMCCLYFLTLKNHGIIFCQLVKYSRLCRNDFHILNISCFYNVVNNSAPGPVRWNRTMIRIHKQTEFYYGNVSDKWIGRVLLD